MARNAMTDADKLLRRADFIALLEDELEQAIYQLWQSCLQPSTMTSLR